MLKRLLATFFCVATPLCATPTTLFWTTVTTNVLDSGLLHIDIDNYFTLNRRDVFCPNREFPTDLGLLYGLFDWNGLKCEIGVDYLAATLDPWYFNIKMGAEENKLCENSPSFAVGIYNMGTRHQQSYRGRFSCIIHPRTDENVLYGSLGKTVFENLRIFVGAFHLNKYFGTPNGALFGVDYKFKPEVHCDGTNYFKWDLCADWASGKNVIGGSGVAVSYYFTPRVTIETGPVFFNSTHWNGRWKWSTQVNVDIPLFS